MEFSKGADVKNTNQAVPGTQQVLHFLASVPPFGNCPTWALGLLLATTVSTNGSHAGPTFLLVIDDSVHLLRNVCVKHNIITSYPSCALWLTKDNPEKEAGQGGIISMLQMEKAAQRSYGACPMGEWAPEPKSGSKTECIFY